MRNIILLTSLLLLVVFISGCAQYGQSGGTQANSNQVAQTGTNVKIKNFAFEPSEIRIKKGETVVWTNEDSVRHTVTSDSGNELNSQSLSSGQTYSHIFNDAGTFDYRCSIHSSMKAKVTVE